MGFKYLLGLLTLILVVVWLAVFRFPDNKLHIVACDVGQGDAILIFERTNQILIDGGPNDKVMDCLNSYIPFWDTTIELVINTHPQKDHYGGLIDVMDNYEVDTFMATQLDSTNKGYGVLKDKVVQTNTRVINPTAGMKLELSNMTLEVIHPNSELVTLGSQETSVLGAFTSKADPNDFSVVVSLNYGEFDALFTGDIGPAVAKEIIASGRIKQVEYLKVPHHGSKNGLIEEFLEATRPEIAVISVGKNQWGHPHKEILDMLMKFNINTSRTDEGGAVETITNGSNFF